ncbi:phage/plasmid primase, P4 family (plasmid) [Apilactobacillus kunkeei]|nr:phage/plasmid primase, P4 family [Apilactobacillus kunkeei]
MTNVKQTVSVVDQWAEIEKLANMGFKLYPVKITLKETITRTEENGDVVYFNRYDKKPTIKAWQNNATDNIQQLKEWFKPDKNGKITPNGVAFIPKASGIITIDLDNHDGKSEFRKWCNDHEKNGEDLLLSTMACERTAGKGLHLFFKNDTGLDIKDGMHIAPGVELKVNSTTIYPSENYDIPSSEYDYKPLSAAELKPMPQWLKDEIKNALDRKNKAYVDDNPLESRNVRAANWMTKFMDKILKGIPAGSRNNEMATIVGELYYIYGNPNDVAEKAKIINQLACKPPLKQSELNGILKSMERYPEHATIKVDPLPTDVSAAKEVRNWMKENPDVKKLPYDVAAEIMLKHYSFVRFSEDEGERVAIYINDRRSSKYGLYVQNYDYIRQLINTINKTYSSRDIREVIEKIELTVRNVSEPTVDKNLVAVKNGIFDIKNKELKPFTPNIVFTSKVATAYNPKFKDSKNIPNFDGWNVDQWLEKISQDENGVVDTQVVHTLWQVLADSFNGNYSHHKAIFLYSTQGNSGKGSFQKLIHNVIGKSNIAELGLPDFAQRFSMSQLINKTACIGDDIGNGVIKNSANFNSATTGDPIRIEIKGQTAFGGVFRGAIIQSMNELPKFTNKGGTYRRLLIIPFRQHFIEKGIGENGEDANIKNLYLNNQDVKEYVLYKALNQYSDFEFYDIPDVSLELMHQFKKDNDPVQEFYESVFKEWDIDKITVKALYTAYQRYCTETGVMALGRNNFVHAFLYVAKEYRKASSRITRDEYNKLYEIQQDRHNTLLAAVDISSGKTSAMCMVRMGTIK